jgi:ABC-type transport system substrate-binding protein
MPAPTPAPAPTGAYGELRIAVASFGQETFNPIKADSVSTEILLSPILDYMFIAEGGNLINGLVERWELAPDALSWTYYIRKGVKSHDGSDLTAKDVKFSLESYAAQDAFYGFMRAMIDHIEIIDDYTVRIYTQGTLPDFRWEQSDSPVASGAAGMVMPKDYVERNGIAYYVRHPVGSGPWKYAGYVPGDMVAFEAVDKHWRQAPEFKKLTIILMPEETTRVASLKTGELDETEIGLDAAHELELAGYKTLPLGAYSVMVLLHGAYQAGAGPIADVRVRQALSLAINREEINNALFYGKAGPPGPPFLSEDAGGFDLSYWMSYAAKAYRYDTEEAKQLLKEAGYPNGFSMQLWSYAMTGSANLPKLAEIVQGYWLKIGVKAKIVPTEDGAFRTIRNPLKSPTLIGQASTYRYSSTAISSKCLLAGFHSTMGNFSLVGKAMPEFDSLLGLASSETNPTKREDLLAKAIQMAFDTWTTLNMVTIPLLHVGELCC